MKYELSGLNLVVLFSDNGKHTIKISELTNLFPNETPTIFWDESDPISPGIINYQNSGLDISVINNRYQIQSKAVNGDIPSYFSDVLEKALHAAKERSITAYGFNFYFICHGIKEVKEIFNISVKNTSFIYQPKTFLRLTFKKDNTLFVFEISDGNPFLTLHINVHHDENPTLEILVQSIKETLNSDYNNAQQLIREVLAVDK